MIIYFFCINCTAWKRYQLTHHLKGVSTNYTNILTYKGREILFFLENLIFLGGMSGQKIIWAIFKLPQLFIFNFPTTKNKKETFRSLTSSYSIQSPYNPTNQSNNVLFHPIDFYQLLQQLLRWLDQVYIHITFHYPYFQRQPFF